MQRGVCRSSQKQVTCENYDQEIFTFDHSKKRPRDCQIDDDECDSNESIDPDSEDVGGILTTRTNRFHIPRDGIRSLHVMLFVDTDAPQPNFDGCAWAKILLTSYYLVMAVPNIISPHAVSFPAVFEPTCASAYRPYICCACDGRSDSRRNGLSAYSDTCPATSRQTARAASHFHSTPPPHLKGHVDEEGGMGCGGQPLLSPSRARV